MLNTPVAGRVSAPEIRVVPAVVPIGESLTVAVELTNEGPSTQQLRIDLRVHFVKSNGRPNPKVFKLKELDLTPHASAHLVKKNTAPAPTIRGHIGSRSW